MNEWAFKIKTKADFKALKIKREFTWIIEMIDL